MSISIDRPTSTSHPSAPYPQWNVPTAAYLHIPFCRRRCYYCDFAVSIVGDAPPQLAPTVSPSSISNAPTWHSIAQYVDILCQEIISTPTGERSLDTVFFGGGTPSLLTVPQLEQILTTVDRHIGIASGAEISVEMDPGTFDRAKLHGYSQLGVNRISLGVQAFQANLLAACGRSHTPNDIHAAVEAIHQVGLQNVSLDLISGLPHQTMDDWNASLQQAIALDPTHLSVYDLTIEPETAFGRQYTPGADPLPSDEQTADMYRLAQQTLTRAGFQHYEVSNYAKPGYQCRHNRVYWENRPYYGFGMGAASYVQGQRFTRPRKRSDYYPWVQWLTANHGKIDCPVTSLDEMLLDRLMVGLRLAEGLSLAELATQFGSDKVNQILDCVQPYHQQGWVAIVDETPAAIVTAVGEERSIPSHQRLCLTDPEGFLFSNVVLAKLFEKLT